MNWKRRFVRNWGRLGMKYKTWKLGEFLYIKGRIGWKGLKKNEYLSDGKYRIINGESLTKDDRTISHAIRKYAQKPIFSMIDRKSTV